MHRVISALLRLLRRVVGTSAVYWKRNSSYFEVKNDGK